LLLAGFSFGAWVGLRVGCADARVDSLIGLGVPVNTAKFDFLLACVKPKLFVQGTEDQYGARERVATLVGSLADPKRLVFIEGVDHFFTGKLDEVARAITAWMIEQRPALGESLPEV
jgi:alpha/beta superfamily hydrolase